MKVNLKDKAIWDKCMPWLVLSTYILVLGILLWNYRSIVEGLQFIISLFQSFLYAIMIAYILNLPMTNIEKGIVRLSRGKGWLYRHKRTCSLILTFLLAIIFVLIIGSIIIPSIISSFISLLQNISFIILEIVKNIDKILQALHLNIKVEEIEHVENILRMPWEDVVSKIIPILSGSASNILNSASIFLSGFFEWFTSFIFSLYLLSSKEALLSQVRQLTAAFLGYQKSVKIFYYASRVNKIFSSFISGQLVEACILWIMYFFLMRIFHFPFVELICTLIAVLSIVPVFGAMTAMCIGAIVIFSIDPMQSLWFIIFYQTVSYFEDNVIYPRVVGKSVGLPGLWVLLCILIFGSVFGIVGMIIAVPTTACIYTFLKEYVHKRLQKQKLIVTDKNISQRQ